MTTHAEEEPAAAAPLIDLQTLLAAVRGRRRLWSSLALFGLLAGAVLACVLVPPPTATVKVLVAHQEDQPNDPGTLIRTDVALLHTTRIAGEALRSLGSPVRPEEFMEEYEGLGLTNNLMGITVSGGSEAEAVARAGALADAFVADHVRRLRETADAEAKALLDQRDRMRDELSRVNGAIAEAAREKAPAASADMESLFARRAELTSRISDFDQRAAQARVGTPRLVAGTQIVDAPRAVPHSLPKAVAVDAAIGLALGLALGLAVAAVGSVVADRPVLRREIAAHLGASVVAELPRRSWRRRTREARERLTRSLARTVRGAAGPVSLLELGCARETGAVALDLARALGADGPVAVVDGLPGLPLAGRRPAPGDPVVVDGGGAAELSHRERRLGVGSVAPGAAWADLPQLGARAVLFVRAGFGSVAWLHAVARHLADQRVPVVGVVLVDPDPRDRTDGTLWDGAASGTPRAPEARRSPRNGGDAPHARGAVGEGRWRTDRLPVRAARVPDSDQEAR
ncbi:Wzz/FepE/Etk N-terminal domain-containing protein [Streptomyces roseolus]|uniref:Wzz/FepE/Etk N-terminal domain-containing protein n=1 Tax=Streptomyces roseolus TaxID=67358 RepID=UPI001671D735|nr:Wzz/FepE/Etk N-terminal domain-containing protein [Streptomyces roseolus]GGR62800.1 membrane-bound polysaccharide biosynthesis protein [Streptomyces roseolus]